MIRNVCLKSTLRQPARTLLLLLLMGLISFAFISQAVECLVVNRETDRLAGYYRAIGILDIVDPISAKLLTGMELVSESQYTAFADWPQPFSGVLQGVFNADVHGYRSDDPRHLVSSVLVYGELRSKSHMTGGYQFILHVDQVAAGYPEYAQEGGNIRLRYFSESPGDFADNYDTLEVGGRYFVKAHYEPSYNRTWQSASDNLILRPLNDNGLWFLPIEPGATASFTDPALTGLLEDLRVMVENQHTMRVYGTKDMSAMPIVQDVSRLHYLVEGRWLDRVDDLSGSRVCVVHRDFAALRGLSVGDTLTLKLRDLKAPNGGYIVSGKDWGAWQDYETHIEAFEIVGLYGILSTQGTEHSTYMYIPDSCMPASDRYTLTSWNGLLLFSVVLRSPQDVDAFLAENREALEELGLRLSVLENGWETFQASVGPLKQSAVTSAAVSALVLLLSLILAAFLYLRQRRRDFAILLSLGLPKRAAIRQVLQPMALVGAIGILMGGLPSWRYALGKAAGTLASLQGPRGTEPSAALSLIWLVGLCVVVLALLLLFTVIGARITARCPVLELLQGATACAARRRKPDIVRKHPEGGVYGTQIATGWAAFSLGEASAPARTPGFAQAFRYVLRHIRRGALKSMLTVAVALCFALAMGWMSWAMERNEAELERLYRSIRVEVEIVKSNPSIYVSGGFIRPWTVGSILKSGFVQSAYLEAAAKVPLVAATGEAGVRDDNRVARNVSLRAFDLPERFFSTRGKGYTVEYADGWDESLFTKEWPVDQVSPVLLSAGMIAQLRLTLGDLILIPNGATGAAVTYLVAGQYVGSVWDDAILLPISALKQLEGNDVLYDVAKFVLDPDRNRELPVFRSEMDTYFTKMNPGIVDLMLVYWAGELTQVVEPLEKNLSLMAVLYPVTVAVSTLIAAGLTALRMLQAARDAAIMRVLGTTKVRAQAMLCGEQLSLSLIGLLLGLALLISLRQDAFDVLAGPALVCAGLYLAGAICGSLSSAIFVTNRMPLELLQVKE